MVETIDQILRTCPVPDPHDPHIDEKGNACHSQAILEFLCLHQTHGDTGEDKISKPVRKTDVPAIPELNNIKALGILKKFKRLMIAI